MLREDTFKNKVVLVTGGRSGIGYQIAKDLLGLGATVWICSRKEELLMKAQKSLVKFGTVEACKCDIRKEEDLASLAEKIKTKSGRLDILVNNAGGQFPSLTEYISHKGWNAVINNNLNGTFYIKSV